MENRKQIYFFGLLFSAVFALVYYGLFHFFLDQDTEVTHLFYNQVGLYKSEENAQKVINQLAALEIDGYILMHEDLHAVICGISDDQGDTKANGDILAKQEINYIEKEWVGKDDAALNAFRSKDMDTVLEMMNDESKGNEQTGAAT